LIFDKGSGKLTICVTILNVYYNNSYYFYKSKNLKILKATVNDEVLTNTEITTIVMGIHILKLCGI